MPAFNDFSELRRLLAGAPCLSIRQPWTELILLERKKVELRQWSTQHRGWIWLHTGKTFGQADYDRFGFTSLFTGGFVGAFRLRDVVPLDSGRWEAWRSTHLDLGDCPANVFGWVVADPIRLAKPITAPGTRGLYRPDGDLAARLLAQPFVGEAEAT
ncbi:hypothetical protein ACFKHW_37610 [Bradyrhizobium lupini]|uniref:hypothetical protein n=1 Tax=Rhizobium lupini TaxID=136996 RepID=UPI00366CE3E7